MLKTKEKNLIYYAGVIFLVYMFIAFIMSGSYITNGELYAYNWHIILSIVISGYIFVLSFKENRAMPKKLEDKPIRKFLFRILILTFLPLVLWAFFITGFFAPIHYLIEDDSKLVERSYFIKDKSSRRNHRWCLKFQKPQNLTFGGNRICGFEKAYKSTEIGDKIIVKGTETIFGFSVKAIRYNKK